MVTDLAGKFRGRTGMPVDLTVDILAGAQDLQRKLAELGEPTPDLRYGQAVALNELAAAYADQGKSHEGVKAGEQARDILVDLLRLQPANTLWKQSLADSHHRIGNVHAVAFRALGANEYEQALTAIARALRCARLRAIDPSNSRVGKPYSREPQRDRRHDARRDGNNAGALESYRESLAIRKRLAADHPGDPRWQARLSTSLMEVATVLPRRAAREKLETFRASVKALQEACGCRAKQYAMAARLVGWLRLPHQELVEANEYEAALDAAQNGIEIVQDLLKGDPGNSGLATRFLLCL